MKFKRILSLLMVMIMAFGTVQAGVGFAASALNYSSEMLNALIKNQGIYVESLYTPETYKNYTAVLAEAKAVNSDSSTSAQKAEETIASLAAAEAALTLKDEFYHSKLNLLFPNTALGGETFTVKFKDALGNGISNITFTAQNASSETDFVAVDDGFYTNSFIVNGATGDVVEITVNYTCLDKPYTFTVYVYISAEGTVDNKLELGPLLAKAYAMNRQPAEYSAGYSTYIGVLKSSIITYVNPTSTTTKVERAVKNMNSAVENLVGNIADYTRVYDLIAYINTLNPDDYDSFAPVTTAVDQVRYNLTLDKQDIVDAYADNIEMALDSLVYKSVSYYVKCVDADGNVLENNKYSGAKTYTVTIEAPTIPGYSPRVEKQVIIITEDEQTVEFVYDISLYTVTFHPNGGSVDVESIIVEYGKEYGTLPVPVREGYNFNGWYTSAYGGSAITDTMIVGIDYPPIVYARWGSPESYQVKFNANGGEFEETDTDGNKLTVRNLELIYGNEFALPVPVRPGYTFLGWYYDRGTYENKLEFEVVPDLGENGSVSNVYAKWERKSYDVTLEIGDESEISSTTYRVTYGDPYGQIPKPSKVGHTFVGWFTQAEGGEQILDTTTVTAYDAHTLYAHYTVNQYTIYFDMDGGDAIDSITADYGSPIVLSKEPAKKYYIFSNWAVKAADGSYQAYQLTTMPAENITVVAVWTLNAKVTYYIDVYRNKSDNTREKITTIEPGEKIQVEISLKTNYDVGSSQIDLLYDKRTFGSPVVDNTATAKSPYYSHLNMTSTTVIKNNNYVARQWQSKFDNSDNEILTARLANLNCRRLVTNGTGYAQTADGKTHYRFNEKTMIMVLNVTVSKFDTETIKSGVFAIAPEMVRTPEDDNTQLTYVSCMVYQDDMYVEDQRNLIHDCSNSIVELGLKGESSDLIPSTGSTTTIDAANGLVYGLAENLTFESFKASYASAEGDGTLACTDTVLKTGSVIQVVLGGKVVKEYTVVIYGDVNMNGKADATDCFLVDMIVAGTYPQSKLSKAQLKAADANRDGKITAADGDLLADVGLLKATVTQAG